MEQKELLCKALKWSAWGYFFLYFNINIGTLHLLPAWIGYMLFYNAIKTSISQYESSANLLKPLCFFLGIYQFAAWVMGILGGSANLYLIDAVISVIALYFHFQFLTNLSNIAGKYHCTHQKSLLTMRNIQTILTTVLMFLVYSEWYGAMLAIAVIQMITGLCIFGEVRSLRIALERMPEDKWSIYTNIELAEKK